MSEISREDAKLNIKAIRDLWDSEYDYKSEYEDFLEDDAIETLNKAISDMEKLDKITELLEKSHKNAYIWRDAQIYLNEIEKILDGKNDD